MDNRVRRRVVITGLGAVAPTGLTMPEVWQAALAGENGIGPITHFDSSDYSTKIAGELKGFDPLLAMSAKEVRRSDPFLQYANNACKEALEDSRLDLMKEDPFKIGVIIASGIGGIQILEEQARVLRERGVNRITPFFIPMMISDMAAGDISIRYGLKGPNYATVSACASAAHALLDAYNLLQIGYAEVMVAGGCEAPITPLSMAGFCQIRAMSTRNDEPHRASRPFDSERDGFVIGEGSAIAILETLEHARGRGARIYAEFLGGGMTADAYHMTAPEPSGEGMAESMNMAMRMSGIDSSEVDYINAHGTSTPLNDEVESKAIRRIFGDHADTLNISSTKSMVGHLLGASGAIEFNVLTMAIQEGKIPPTINYENPDPACNLNYTPNAFIERALEVGLSNSFGFGGHNVTLAVRQFHDET